MTLHKILCPIDFSPGSQQAMRTAVRLARESNAELVIAHAWYIPAVAMEYPMPPAAMQSVIVEAERGLVTALADAKSVGAERVTSRLLRGIPWVEITNLLEADPAFDLVVAGTHGRTGLKRVLLGSVAEKIVRHAACSVLVVRPDGELRPFSRVLCPIDFSDSSQHALDVAAGLVQPGKDAALTLLHVIEAPVAYAGEPEAAEFLRDLDKRSAELLEQWATQLRGKTQVPVTSRIRLGPAGAQTLAALEDDSFDLVVTGSHGRTGIRRVLLGSVAEKIVRHAPCPVLVARQRSGKT